MLHALASWLTLIAPLALAVSVAAFAWRRVRKPLVFLSVAVFALLAIQALVIFFIAGYLPPGEPDIVYLQMGVLAAALAAAVGCPILWVLYRRLRHPGHITRGA